MKNKVDKIVIHSLPPNHIRPTCKAIARPQVHFTGIQNRQMRSEERLKIPSSALLINTQSFTSALSTQASNKIMVSARRKSTIPQTYNASAIIQNLANIPKNFQYHYFCTTEKAGSLINDNCDQSCSNGFTSFLKCENGDQKIISTESKFTNSFKNNYYHRTEHSHVDDNFACSLFKISHIVSDHPSTISAEIAQKVYNAFESHFIHKIPDISDTLVVGETFDTYDISDWEILSSMYSILSILASSIVTFLKYEQIDKMIKMLNSPVTKERLAMLQLLKTIFALSINHRIHIFVTLIEQCNNFNDDRQQLPFFICPSFEFFTGFFSKLPPPLNPSYIDLFKKTFYPLVKHDYVSEYYTSTVQLFTYFQSSDTHIPIWCANFLLKSWPVQSSHKQIIFLHQFSVLLPFLIDEFKKNTVFGGSFLKRLSKCILSHNYKVSLSAIGICKDDNLRKLFKQYSDEFEKWICPAIRESAANHWCEDVRNLANYLVLTLNHIFPKKGMKLNQNNSSEDVNMVKNDWKLIVEIAGKKYEGFDSEYYQELIKSI